MQNADCGMRNADDGVPASGNPQSAIRNPQFLPLPLLITGIAGVAGYNALHYFQRKYPGQVIGIRQQDNWRMVGEGIESCNAEDYDGLSRLFDKYAFRSVLDCAGNCDLKACELNPPMARRINVDGVRNLLNVIAKHSGEPRASATGAPQLSATGALAQQSLATAIRLVHLSVDLVFGGWGNGNLTEEAPTDPVTMYGKTMVEAEQILFAERPDACTLRISLPMGISFNGHAGAIDWIQSRFKKSKPATMYVDEIRTPTYTDCLNELCEAALFCRCGTSLRNKHHLAEPNATLLHGLYHAGAPRWLSLYQVGQIVNRVGGYAPRLLMGCLRHEAGPIPPRAGNVAMNSQKLVDAIGYQPFDPWPLDEAFVPTHARWHEERPTGEGGSPELLSEVLYRNPARRRRAAG